ncbi:MAG: sensor histidine kinase [Planctomycetota bacterium]
MTADPDPSADLPPGLLLPDEARRTRDLLSQVAWFNRLRLFAAAAVIWFTALATHLLGVLASPWQLYSLGGLIAAVDGCYMLWFPRLARRPARSVRGHVFLQIAIDLLILTALLHYTGGITNPLVLFYLFHAFIAALVLSVRAAFAVGAMSLAMVVALAAAERLGVLEHHSLGLGLMDLRTVSGLGFALLLFAYAMTIACSIYFVATVLRRLRANEQQLVRLGRHLALSEKLASIGTLAAGVSHEINNPVGVITNKVQVLRYRVEDGDPPDALLQELDVVEKHARRIGQITAGLLTFSREAPFELRAVELGTLVREAGDLVRVPFRTARVDLTILGGDPVHVRGSQNHLLQVLINILLNAKDASAAGAVVELRWRAREGEAEIAIADQGCGIEPAVLAKVFDPFFTTKDVDKGTGLGLAISHGIVERHGGRIEVESAVGRGTTFRVLLPLG